MGWGAQSSNQPVEVTKTRFYVHSMGFSLTLSLTFLSGNMVFCYIFEAPKRFLLVVLISLKHCLRNIISSN